MGKCYKHPHSTEETARKCYSKRVQKKVDRRLESNSVPQQYNRPRYAQVAYNPPVSREYQYPASLQRHIPGCENTMMTYPADGFPIGCTCGMAPVYFKTLTVFTFFTAIKMS